MEFAENAHADADQAVRLLESVIGADPPSSPNSENTLLLAMALTSRAVASGTLGDNHEAQKGFQQALERARTISRDSEFYGSAQIQVASTLNQFGELLGQKAETREQADQCFADSIKILEPIVKGNPHYLFVREELATSHSGRCRNLINLERWELAGQHITASTSMLEGLLKDCPGNAEYLSLSAHALELAGRIQLHSGQEVKAQELRIDAKKRVDQALGLDPERSLDRKIRERLDSQAVGAQTSRAPTE